MYLFARFWAHIEILKQEGLSVAISQDERGKGALVHFAGSGQGDPKPKRLRDDRLATNGIRAPGGQH